MVVVAALESPAPCCAAASTGQTRCVFVFMSAFFLGLADQRVSEWVAEVFSEITSHLDDRNRGEITRSGVKIALLGAPNAGKSSLLNALARRDVAIVSSIPGDDSANE